MGDKPRIETMFNYVKISHAVVVLAEMMIMNSPELQPRNADHQPKRYTVGL